MNDMTLSAMLKRLLPLVAAVALLTLPATAQQPTSVNPTASSVKEKQLLEALKPNTGDTVSGRISIPDARAGNLIQPAGREFRAFREQTVTQVGTYAILGTLALLCLFYLFRGRVRTAAGPSGQTILRFGSLARFAHWLSATSFLLLGLTGLNLVFGRSLVLPVIGPDAFTTVTQAGKFVHNYVSFAFALGIVLMFVMWVKDNLPSGKDLTWFAQGGGLIGSKHPPAERFNGGQKLIFWSTVLGGAALSVSGYVMMFRPAGIVLGGLQLATIVHGLTGLIMIAIILAHIYIGTLGMEGAFDAMGKGRVDMNWAKEHHSLWAARIAKERPKDISGSRNPAPAE
jgi:formate dehydrogenase subunit gamma